MRCSFAGDLDCLKFAFKHGCPLENFLLDAAIRGSRLRAVKMLVAQGLPNKPFLQAYAPTSGGKTGGNLCPDQLRCLQYLLDKGCPIHPATLISAARRGDLDTVRFLHSKGVPLWDAAQETGATYVDADDYDDGLGYFAHTPVEIQEYFRREYKVIAVPQTPEDAAHMWAALRYGCAMGAPVTPVVEDVFAAKRAATRAALLCFHAAGRPSQGTGSLTQGTGSLAQGTGSVGNRMASVIPGIGSISEGTGSLCQGTGSLGQGTGSLRGGTGEQTPAWAAMGRMPAKLFKKILLHANLEIPESVGRDLPARRSVKVHMTRNEPCSNTQVDLWVYVNPVPPNKGPES
jgi:hypothetical protein